MHNAEGKKGLEGYIAFLLPSEKDQVFSSRRNSLSVTRLTVGANRVTDECDADFQFLSFTIFTRFNLVAIPS